MPRPQKSRKVCNPPKMQGFKPFGIVVCDTEMIIMQYDEYETIKLVNYDNLSQDDAAERMEISRPTLTRIYNSALFKIAQAFVEGKSIIIQGGNFEFAKDWYKCKKCFRLIEGIENHIKCSGCNRFGQDELEKLNKNSNNQ
ncbi:MAG TPA: hypothetical protein DCQ31_01730 [Bacteroidales bacterium]|nr:hypothetical protein [Bacteroidales bacterium]